VTGDRSRAEEARIRAAYARRGGAWRYDWGNPAYVFAMQDLERRVLAALRALGSGRWAGNASWTSVAAAGYWLHRLIAWEHGRTMPPASTYCATEFARPAALSAADHAPCGSALALPFRGASVDLVLQFQLFTSILGPDLRRCVADEMVRVLAPEGAILWYDFNVPNPRNPMSDPSRRLRSDASSPRVRWSSTGHTGRAVTRLVAPLSWTLCALLTWCRRCGRTTSA